jgi:hypothetical protein
MFHLGIHVVLIVFICVCAASLLWFIGGIIVLLRDGNKPAERARRARRRFQARALESLQRYSWEQMKRPEQDDDEVVESLIRVRLNELLVHPARNRHVN